MISVKQKIESMKTENVIREMSASEMTDANGGVVLEAIIITCILLLYSQEAY